MNGLLAEAKKQKVSDDKMLASARVKLRELETQMQTHRADAENLKVLMADQKKGLGLRLLAEGDTAFKSALSELKEFEIKQHAAESAIQHLEEERGKILQIIADLRLKNGVFIEVTKNPTLRIPLRRLPELLPPCVYLASGSNPLGGVYANEISTKFCPGLFLSMRPVK